MDYTQENKSGLRLRFMTGVLYAKLRGMSRRKAFSYLALLICPAITFYLFDLYTHNPFTSMSFKTQLLNIVFYELTGLLFFGLFRYLRLALMVQSGLFMVIGLINYYVLNFRSAPIMPWDIFSVSTAASVAGNFSYELERDTVFVLLSFIALLAVESRCTLKAPGRKRLRAVMIMLPVVFLWSYTGLIQDEGFVSHFGLYDKLFTPAVMNKRDGNIVAFLMEMEYLNVEKPEGYSAHQMGELYEAGKSQELKNALADPASVERPNVIVIMDEAFSDLKVLGKLKTNKDYMPFIHSLQQGADNTITGNLNVSVLGGNTANTEFEFLTGHTMAFLPQGSVAYQQYVRNPEPSLASYFKDLGYSTVAIHPYYADGWDRDRVYPLLGFDEFLSRDDFQGAQRLRGYISDEAGFQKIRQLYEEKEPGEPLFVFNVTMQNHSGYDEEFENFEPDIAAEGISSPALGQYLSLLKYTDQAFERLVNYFSRAEEDTVIVFFGDHQPSTYVSNPIRRAEGIDPDTLTAEENLLNYKVPYVIWSNFDSHSGQDRESSPNYLGIDVLNQCGLPLPPYQSYLAGLRREYPVISALQIRDKQGKLYEMDQRREELNTYRSLEYYLLFDFGTHNRKEILTNVSSED